MDWGYVCIIEVIFYNIIYSDYYRNVVIVFVKWY